MAKNEHINSLAELISGGLQQTSRMIDMKNGYYALITQPRPQADAFSLQVFVKDGEGQLQLPKDPLTHPAYKTGVLASNSTIIRMLGLLACRQSHPNAQIPLQAIPHSPLMVSYAAIKRWVAPEVPTAPKGHPFAPSAAVPV